MFRVSWKRSARQELAALWLAADSATRQAITAASHWIDAALGGDPLTHGESRDEGDRILFADPLVVDYHVDPAQSKVRVLQVRLLRRPR